MTKIHNRRLRAQLLGCCLGSPVDTNLSYEELETNPWGFHIFTAPETKEAVEIEPISSLYCDAFRGTLPLSTKPSRQHSYRLARYQVKQLEQIGIPCSAAFYVRGLVGTRTKGPYRTLNIVLLKNHLDGLFKNQSSLLVSITRSLNSEYCTVQERLQGHLQNENLSQALALFDERNLVLARLASFFLPKEFVESLVDPGFFFDKTAPLLGRYCVERLYGAQRSKNSSQEIRCPI